MFKIISIFVVWKHILILNLSRWHLRCVLDHLTTTDNVSYSVYNLPHPSSPFFPLLWNIFVLIFNSSLYFYSCLYTYSYLYFYIIPFYSRYYQIGVAVHLKPMLGYDASFIFSRSSYVGMFWCVNIVRMCWNSCGLQDILPLLACGGAEGDREAAKQIEFFRFDIWYSQA